MAGRWRRTASTQPSTVNRSSRRERAAVDDALQHAEQPAEVHERRVDDGHAACAAAGRRSRVRLVVLGADEHPLEGLVGEVDALRRAGRPAREHPHRDARPARRRRAVPGPRRRPRASAPSSVDARPSWRRARRAPGRRGRRARRRARAGRGRRCRRGCGRAAAGVDRDDAPAGPQHAEQRARSTTAGCAAGSPTSAPGAATSAATASTVAAELAPGVPPPLELDGAGAAGSMASTSAMRADSPAPGVASSQPRLRPSAAGRSATSAMPSGLPSRV